MAITKRVGGALVTAVAAVAVIGLSATPAMASTTLTVHVTGGGSITAKTGTSSKDTTVLTDNGVSVTCMPSGKGSKFKPSSEATGSISNGTHKGATTVAVGKTTKLSFNDCIGLLGKVTNKVESEGNISVDSKTNSAGDSAGVIGPVKVAVSMPSCSFTVTGYAPGYYNNKTHTLFVTPHLPKGLKGLFKAQLTISNEKSCPGGIIKNGQHPTFVANGGYAVSRKVTIKST
jgi:hypothetical protein